jgi:predicted phage-related endonuclease
MSSIEIISKIETLKEYEAIAAEAAINDWTKAKSEAAMIESIKDEIKRHMDTQGVDELTVGTHIIRYTTVLSNRFDSTAFKKVMPDVYKAYTKQTTSRRFSIA